MYRPQNVKTKRMQELQQIEQIFKNSIESQEHNKKPGYLRSGKLGNSFLTDRTRRVKIETRSTQ